jgi:hypothetical protein
MSIKRANEFLYVFLPVSLVWTCRLHLNFISREVCKSLITSRWLEIIMFTFYHKKLFYYASKESQSYPLAGFDLED